MVWCSGWKLASAVSNAGGLGIIGAGSMSLDVLEEHLTKMKSNCKLPFAVNLPLLYKHIDDQIECIIKHKVPIVFTSAGNPSKYTSLFQSHGIKVVHVVSSLKFALKAESAGVDAIVAEGFEAGGHNGRDETTTLVLLQLLKNKVQIPVIAAGGIGSGQAMAAAFCLGAEAVQIGSLFAATQESSAHIKFKQELLKSKEGDTVLTLKEVTPVRLLKNDFYREVEAQYQKCASPEELKNTLGKGRAKKGIFEGDLENGELEIGQISAAIENIPKAGELVQVIWKQFQDTIQDLKSV